MTIYDTCKTKLENHPDFRERRYRCDRLAILALRALEYEEQFRDNRPLSISQLVDFANKYDSYRHEYDAVQRDCPDLQGKDYPDKKKLVQEKLLEFGYDPLYNYKLPI